MEAMPLLERIPFRPASFRRHLRERAVEEPPAPVVDGPPQDRATYNCSCGYVFEADVTTSIRCPHCTVELAW